MRKTLLVVIMLLAITTTLAYVTVYTYRYAVFNISIAPPVTWFEDPRIPGIRYWLQDRLIRGKNG